MPAPTESSSAKHRRQWDALIDLIITERNLEVDYKIPVLVAGAPRFRKLVKDTVKLAYAVEQGLSQQFPVPVTDHAAEHWQGLLGAVQLR